MKKLTDIFVLITEINTLEKKNRILEIIGRYYTIPISEYFMSESQTFLMDIEVAVENDILTSLHLKSALWLSDDKNKPGHYIFHKFEKSVFNLSDKTIDLMIQRSRLKDILAFVYSWVGIRADWAGGGFDWYTTTEGVEFWNKEIKEGYLLKKKDLKITQIPNTMCKIDYKNKKLISKEAIEEKKVGFYIRDTKINLEKELLTREQARANTEDELKTFKCEYPLNLDNIISREQRLVKLDLEIETIKNLQKEFGFDKEDKKGK